MKRNTIIFDLDGTILDTLGGIFHAVKATLNKYGYIIEKDMDEFKMKLGFGPRYLIQSNLPVGIDEEELLQIINDYTKFYSENYLHDTYPYPGIEDLLQELKRQGKKLIVISNKQDVIVKKIVDKMFPNIFDKALGARKDLRPKPYLDIFEDAFGDLLDKESIIFIGDSEVDNKMAQNLGVPFIACSHGFRDRQFLEKEGVEHIADDVSGIKKLIEKLEIV